MSVVGFQLSVIACRFSVISFQSSVVSCRVSVSRWWSRMIKLQPSFTDGPGARPRSCAPLSQTQKSKITNHTSRIRGTHNAGSTDSADCADGQDHSSRVRETQSAGSTDSADCAEGQNHPSSVPGRLCGPRCRSASGEKNATKRVYRRPRCLKGSCKAEKFLKIHHLASFQGKSMFFEKSHVAEIKEVIIAAGWGRGQKKGAPK